MARVVLRVRMEVDGERRAPGFEFEIDDRSAEKLIARRQCDPAPPPPEPVKSVKAPKE